jgi:hypothetical protein
MSAQTKLTPWFPAGVQPVRKGMYETRAALPEDRYRLPQYQRWDGTHWLAWASDFEAAAQLSRDVSFRQKPEWRGLAKRPSIAAATGQKGE